MLAVCLACSRYGAGITAGDDVDVDVELDTAPREVSVPEDVAGALTQVPAAKATFEKLAYSHQLRWVTSVQEAKTPQTRQRRIDKMITALQEG